MKKTTLLKSMFLLCALIAGSGSSWATDYVELYSADFSTVAQHSYTQNKTFTLSEKSWTASVSQVDNNGVFYLGCNSNNSAKGVLNNNTTFSSVVTALCSADATYNSNKTTAHAYALLFENAYSDVTKLTLEWVGTNNLFQVYIFGDSGEGWVKLASKQAANGVSESGSLDWTGSATNFTKFAIVARPGASNSTATNKTLRNPTFTIYKNASTDPTLSCSPASASAFTYVHGEGPSDAQDFTISGSNLTTTITAALTGSNYEMKTGSGEWGTADLTGLESDAVVSVRLKDGLALGDRNGTLTFSSTGASDVAISLTGTVTKPAAGLAYAVPSFKVATDMASFPTPTLTNPHSVTVAYSSSDEDVALPDENTGEIIVGSKVGTTTITATYDGSGDYLAGTATYTITTYDATANDGSEAKPYTVAEAISAVNAAVGNKVNNVYVKGIISTYTSYSDSYKNAEYFISDDGTTTTQLQVYHGKYLGGANMTSEDQIAVGDEVVIFGNLKIYSSQEEFDNGNYIVKLKHGSEPEVKSLQVTASKYRTYVASENLVVPSGVKAYIATASTSDDLTLTEVPKIKSGSPVVLYADVDETTPYTFEVTDEDVTYSKPNLLQISNGTTINGVYVLAKKGGNVKFYKWAGGALSPGRVYVEAPGGGAREYLDFNFEEGDVTGVAAVEEKKNVENNIYYNLAGQRVQNPIKGLYIVNGKKVIK